MSDLQKGASVIDEFDARKKFPECLHSNIHVHLSFRDRVKILLTGRLDILHRTYLGEPVKEIGPAFSTIVTFWPIRWPRKPVSYGQAQVETPTPSPRGGGRS